MVPCAITTRCHYQLFISTPSCYEQLDVSSMYALWFVLCIGMLRLVWIQAMGWNCSLIRSWHRSPITISLFAVLYWYASERFRKLLKEQSWIFTCTEVLVLYVSRTAGEETLAVIFVVYCTAGKISKYKHCCILTIALTGTSTVTRSQHELITPSFLWWYWTVELYGIVEFNVPLDTLDSGPYTVKTRSWPEYSWKSKHLYIATTAMGGRNFSTLRYINKKLSWCWQTRTTHLEVSQGHQTWYHAIC